MWNSRIFFLTFAFCMCLSCVLRYLTVRMLKERVSDILLNGLSVLIIHAVKVSV